MDKRQLRDKLSDPGWRLRNLYYIEDEAGQPVLFRPRPLQLQFLKNVWYWNIILKARQLGFTTLIDICILARVLFNANTKAGIICHTREAAEEIFRTKVKFAYDRLPQFVKDAIPCDTSRAQQLVFGNGSSIRVATSMRSGTLQYLHVSEYGKVCAQFPEKAKEIRLGSFPAVHAGSFCFIESTAEGVGGDFYDRCQTAMRKVGRDLAIQETKFHFFPWYDDPKYSLPVANGWQPDRDTEIYFREMEQATGYTFSAGQKFWYQQKAEDLGDEVRQEYPTIPQEAFLFSGRPRFKPSQIQAALQECFKEASRYELTSNRLYPSANGLLQVWDKPKPGARYAIGCDVSEGLAHGDYSSIDVCDHNGYQVAHWHGHVEPDQLGLMLYELGNWYNHALIGVERNNHGLTTLTKLKDKRYRNLFVQTDLERRAGEKSTKKLGWLTTTRTKPLAVDHLASLLREGTHGIANRETVLEMQTYVIDDKGATNAQDGCFDDRVMSYAIEQQMVLRLPKPGSAGAVNDEYVPVDAMTGY